MIAGIILLASVAGAVLWGGGGVSSWQALTPLSWGAAAALVVQIGCTSIQWTFCADWWNPFYLGALFFSTATTMLGYWPLVHVPLTAAIVTQAGAASFAGYYASFVAGLLILAFALILDILPEKVLTQ